MAEILQRKNEETIELVWFGPFSFRDFIEQSEQVKHHNIPGVYLWLERGVGGERISYVGKAGGTPNLIQRQQEHYANFIGGRYNIPGSFLDGKEGWVPGQYPQNSEIVLNYEQFVELVRAAFKFVQ